MACNEKVSQRCEKLYSPCVAYQLKVPAYSKIVDNSCKSLEDTTKDLYEILGEVKDGIDLSELGKNCLVYVEAGEKAKVKDILIKYESEICSLKTTLEEIQEKSICSYLIEDCDLDLSGISGECETPISTLGDLLNYLISK